MAKPTGKPNGRPRNPLDEKLSSEIMRTKSTDRWDVLFDLINYLIKIGAPESDILLVEDYIAMDFIPDDPNVVILRELIDEMNNKLNASNDIQEQQDILDNAIKKMQDNLKHDPLYNTDSQKYRPTGEMKKEIARTRDAMYRCILGQVTTLLHKVKTTMLTKNDYMPIYFAAGMESSEIMFITQYVDHLAKEYKNNPGNPPRIMSAIEEIASETIFKAFTVDPKTGKKYNPSLPVPQKLKYLKYTFNNKCKTAYGKYYPKLIPKKSA